MNLSILLKINMKKRQKQSIDQKYNKNRALTKKHKQKQSKHKLKQSIDPKHKQKNRASGRRIENVRDEPGEELRDGL